MIMKKITITMVLMLTFLTPSFADFTIKDLFISGGSDKPKDSKMQSNHDCQQVQN